MYIFPLLRRTFNFFYIILLSSFVRLIIKSGTYTLEFRATNIHRARLISIFIVDT